MKKVFAIIGVVFCSVIIIGTPLFFLGYTNRQGTME